jgi:hypothetical protein
VLHSKLGDTAVSLTRDFKGEKVSVDCSVNMQVSRDLTAWKLSGGLQHGHAGEQEVHSLNLAVDCSVNMQVSKKV